MCRQFHYNLFALNHLWNRASRVRFPRLSAVSALLLFVAAATTAEASLQVGNRIRFTNQVGSTNGGEFGVHLAFNANPFDGPGEGAELFRTFCIEKNEFIDFHKNGFVIDSISKAATSGGVGGGNPDPISPQTAWLFYNFTRGTLPGYLGDTLSADNLQKAFWGFEDEIALDLSNPFVVAANAVVTAAGLGDVLAIAALDTAVARTFVINSRWATDRHGFDGVYEAASPAPTNEGTRAQSMLYVMVPEASTMAVWSALSLMGIGAAYRRKARSGV